MQDHKTPKNIRIWITVALLLVIFVAFIVIQVTLIHRQKYNTSHEQEKATLQELIDNTEAIPASSENLVTDIDLTETPVENDVTAENSPAEASEDHTNTDVPATPEQNPYADVFPVNDDMIAWLFIPGTKMDDPVMQTMADENYYLNRGFDKKQNQNGCLIMDTDSDVAKPSTNLIIHGHNMKSGEMFGELENYKSQEYYQQHKIISLYLENERRDYEVIAVFKSQVYKKSEDVFKFYKFFEANNESEFNDFYTNIKRLSLYKTDVDAVYGDCFLTLSTCAYHVDNGRFVVVAKQIDSTPMVCE